jgi:serine/threonine protein kinase
MDLPKYTWIKTLSHKGSYEDREENPPRVIHLYQDRVTSEPVIIKKFLASQDRALDYNILEALDHTQLQSMRDHWVDGEWGFHVIDFVPGKPLTRFFRINQDQKTLAKSLVDLFEPVIYLQNNGLCHGDLVPWDFVHDGQKTSLIDTETVRPQGIELRDFTDLYCAPEQLYGDDKLTFQTDIYALGKSIIHLIGEAGSVFVGDPKRHNDYNHPLQKKLFEVTRHAMLHEPKKRFQTAKEMQEAIAEAVGL